MRSKGAACGRRVFRDDSAGRAVLRRLHRISMSRTHAARAGHVRAQQRPRGRGAGVDLRGAGLLRSRAVLRNSRSYTSILNGHPGTRPAGRSHRHRSDGAGLRRGPGICDRGPLEPALRFLLHDRRRRTAGRPHLGSGDVRRPEAPGQPVRAGGPEQRPARYLTAAWCFPCRSSRRCFESFDWQVHSVDATQYDGVYAALEEFRYGPRNGKPTAIICHSTKGYGALLGFPEQAQGRRSPTALIEQEIALQQELRARRVEEFDAFYRSAWTSMPKGERSRDALDGGRTRHAPGSVARFASAGDRPGGDDAACRRATSGSATTRRCCRRSIRRRSTPPPTSSPRAMKVFARDSRVVSIDSDLATTSGLEAGVAAVDQRRALNVGVAEANMMRIGEAFAALGLQRLDQHVLPVLRLEGAAPHRGGPSGAARSDRSRRTAG